MHKYWVRKTYPTQGRTVSVQEFVGVGYDDLDAAVERAKREYEMREPAGTVVEVLTAKGSDAVTEWSSNEQDG